MKDELYFFYRRNTLNPAFYVMVKGSIVILCLLLFYVMKKSPIVGIGATDANTCIYDRTIEMLTGMNTEIKSTQNRSLTKALQISSSGLIDIVVCSILVVW